MNMKINFEDPHTSPRDRAGRRGRVEMIMLGDSPSSSMRDLRRLCAQQAPVDVVLSCWQALPAFKRQVGLIEALELPASRSSFWSQLPLAYRSRLLKRVLAAIEREADEDDREVDPLLIEAYLQPHIDAESGWSVQTFFVDDVVLPLRVSSGIGGDTETGGRVWDAALGLSALLLCRERSAAAHTVGQSQQRPRMVVELGAGPGLPSLMLSSICHNEVKVIATDVFPATLENLEANVRRLATPAAASRLSVAPLDWCDDADANAARLPAADLILAADVVYEHSLAEPLLRTLDALLRRARSKRGVALLAAERRGDAWSHFEACLRPRLSRGELRCIDRSDEARTALRVVECPFWCAPDAIERLVVLELSAGEGDSAAGLLPRVAPRAFASMGMGAPSAGAGQDDRAGQADRHAKAHCKWEVRVQIAARHAASVRFRISC